MLYDWAVLEIYLVVLKIFQLCLISEEIKMEVEKEKDNEDSQPGIYFLSLFIGTA